MAQSIVVPSGDRLEFPDGMPDSEIEKVIHAEYPDLAPKPSLMSRAGSAIKSALTPSAEREQMPSTADMINSTWVESNTPQEETLSVPGSVMDGYAPRENGQGMPVEAGMGPMRKDYYDQTRAGLLSAPVEKHAAATNAGGQVGKIAAESLPARVVANERAAAGDTQARTMQELGDQTNASLTAQPLRTEATKEANRQWLTENSAGAIEGIKHFTKLDQEDAEAELQQMIRYGVKPSWVDSSMPDATLMQAASANIGATGPALQKALLGLSEAAADQPMLQLPWMDYAKRTPRQLEMTVTNLDKQIRAARNVGGKIESGSWNDVVSTMGPSLATNMPPLIAAALVAAKNPAAGMAIANGGLGVMGMQKFGDNYLKGQMKGLSAADNLTQASLGAAAEVIPEKLSLNSLFAAFKTLGKGSAIDAVKAFAKQQLTEHSTEQITTIADHLIDKAYTEPNKSLESLWSEMKQTAMATAIQAPLLAAGGAAAHITGQAVVGAKQRFDENRDITAGMQFDPGQIDAAARQALDPANAQMRQVGARSAPVPPQASTRAELESILNDDRPVADILAAPTGQSAPEKVFDRPVNYQPAAFGWPDIKTPAVATLPDGQIITGQIAGIQDSDGQPMARFVGADGQVWMIQPGEADIKPAPAAAKRQRKSAFVSSQQFSVDTEDNGKFDVTVHRTASGDVVVNHPDGLMEYKSAFANGKTDAELLAYGFEPVGFRNATQAPAGDGTRTAPDAAQRIAELNAKITELEGYGGISVNRVAELRAERDALVPARQDGTNSVVPDSGMTILHGSGNANLTADGVQIIRQGQKQGKKGRTYGGLYGTSESDIAQAEGYANMMGGEATLYNIRVRPGTKVLNKVGDITRLSEKYINELVSQGYGVVVGKDPRGRTEYVVIDTKAIESMQPNKPPGDGTRTAPVQAETAEHVKIAELAVNTDPSEAQKEAGNYQLGHLAIQGLDIAIENPAGSVRSGVDKAGKPWANTLNHTYGYIKGATAADGDKLDAFIGPDPQSQQVFVIDQIDPDTGKYDEGKVILGASSIDEARNIYLSNYDTGWKGLGAITPMVMPAFKAWIAKGATHKPLAYDQKAAIAERKAAADTQKAGEAYAEEREKAVAAIGENQVAAIEDQVADQNAGQPTIELYRAIATALKAEAARQATQPARQPVQTPSVPSAQPEPVAAAAPSLGFIEAFGSLKNGGATENLLSKAFDALKAGKTTISGIKDPILSRAKPAFDAGLIQSAADLKRFEQDGYPTPKQLEMKARAAAKQGEVNAQDQAVQSQPAVQDLPQAAPEAGALQGELNPEASRPNPVAESQAPAPSEPGDGGVAPTQDKALQATEIPALTKEAAHRLARKLNDDTVAAPHPTKPGMWALMSQEEADAQKQGAEAGADFLASNRAEFRHEGFRIYPISIKGEPRWAVQSLDNSEREKKGERQLGGDSIVDTPEQAKKQAEDQVTERGQKAEDRRQIAEQDAAEEAKKEANRGLSITQRRANAALDKPTNLPVNAGVGRGTRREAMESAVSQERAITAVDVRDTAAYKRDEDEQGRLHRAGYGAFFGNDSHPQKMRFNELSAKLKNRDNYQKKEYRLYMGRDTEGSFYDITKTEYDYAQTLIAAKKAEASTPAPSTPTAASTAGIVIRDEAAFLGAPDALIKRLATPKQRAMLMRGSNVPGGEFTLYEPGTRTHYSKDWKALQGESSAPDPVTVAMRYRTEADIVAMSQEAQAEFTGKAEAIAARQRADESERAIRDAAQAKDAAARETLRASLEGAKFKRGKFQPKGDGKTKIDEVDAWIHGHLAVHKSFGHFKSGQEYTVSHIGTGFSVLSGFKSLAVAKEGAARIERSAPMGELREAADIKKPEFDLFRKIGMAIKSSGGDPLAGAEFDAPTVEAVAATNSPAAEADATGEEIPPKAESDAPARVAETPDQMFDYLRKTAGGVVAEGKILYPAIKVIGMGGTFQWYGDKVSKLGTVGDTGTIQPASESESADVMDALEKDQAQIVLLSHWGGSGRGTGQKVVKVLHSPRGMEYKSRDEWLAKKPAPAQPEPQAQPNPIADAADAMIKAAEAMKAAVQGESKPKEDAGDVQVQNRIRTYWMDNVVPPLRDYFAAYRAMGADRLERNGIKSEGMSATDWLMSFSRRESTWSNGRKTGETGIQYLSHKDLWPTGDDKGEILRKAMLASIKALKASPGSNGSWIESAEQGNYDVWDKPKAAVAQQAAPKSNAGENKAPEDLVLANREIDSLVKKYRNDFPQYFSGASPDQDRGAARIVESHWDELSPQTQEFIGPRYARDAETGESIQAVDSVRGTHIYNIRQDLENYSETDAGLSAEEKIRSAFRALPSITLGKVYPITVEHNGITREFIAYQQAIGRGNNKSAIHLAVVKRGKLLASDESGAIVNTFTLDGKDNLKETGMPRYATPEDLKQWTDAGFKNPMDAKAATEAGKPKDVPLIERKVSSAARDLRNMGAKAFADGEPRNPSEGMSPNGKTEWLIGFDEAKVASEGGKPAATKEPAQGADWLGAMFEQFPDAVPEAPKPAFSDAAIAAVRKQIDATISTLEASRAEWVAKVYKKNRTQVELQGDGPSNRASLSIGSINEKKREKAIAQIDGDIRGLKKFAQALESNPIKAIESVGKAVAESESQGFIDHWSGLRDNKGNQVTLSADERAQMNIAYEIFGDKYYGRTPAAIAVLSAYRAAAQGAEKVSDYKIGGYPVSGLGDKALKTVIDKSSNDADKAAASAELERRKVGAGETATKERFEYPNPKYTSPSDLPAMRAVVDYMNGDITRDAMTQIIVDSGLPEGTIRSITNRLGEDSYSNGEIADIKRRQAAAKETDTGIAFNSLEDDHQSAVSRAIDRAIAIKQGKDVKPLQVIRVRNRIGKLRSDLESGKISEALFISQVESLHAQMEIAAESRRYEPTNGRARGADFLRQKLLEAKRRGDISEQAADMAEWFILKNPALVDDLGIGIRTPKEGQKASGNYNPLNRVMTLFKESASDTTAVHEILHHLERMMPAEMQADIRKEWLRAVTGELQKAQKAKDQKRIAYFEAVLVGNMARATKLLTGEMGWFNAPAVTRMTEAAARDAGFTMVAYRGVSKASPFNDTGTTWLSTDKEVAESYAEEVMGYDDPGVIKVMVKPDGLPVSDMRKVSDEQLESMEPDGFGNPQKIGIYRNSDDHPLGSYSKGVTVIHAPMDAVVVVDENASERFNAVEPAPTFKAVDTESAEFKRWFGGSKVVSEGGKPLVVYHGTTADIIEFDPSLTQLVDGVFLTPETGYASQMARGRQGAGNVLPLYVSLKNPRVIDTSKGDYYNNNSLNAAMSDGKADGVIVIGEDGKIHVVIAFRPEQIKSAISNTGAFDPANPDIRQDLAIGQDYQYLNPSEFWAVRMTNTAAARFEAKSIWARSLQWLKEALEHLKGALGLKSDHPLLKALDDLIKNGTGEFQSKEMLGSSEVYASIEESGPEEVAGTIMRDVSLAARLLLHPRQIAANHKPFVPVFDTAIKQFEERDRIVSGLGEMAKPYFELTHAQRLNVNKIVEQGRLDRTVYTVADLENGIHHAESGDLVVLNAEEIGAYKSLRRTFNEALSLFRDTMLEEFGFAELIPEQKAAAKLRQMIADGEIEESRIEWARHVAKAIDEIEQAKRTGYAPFNRYGQFVVAVKALPAGVEVQEDDGKQLVTGIPEYGDDPLTQIVTDLGGQYDVFRDGWVIDDTRKAVLRALETTLFATKVEVNAFNEWRKQGKDVTDIPEVKAAFDEAKREYGKAPNARVLAFHITEKAKADDANLSTFDELARISDVDVETWDAVREKLQEAIKAKSFRKHFFGSDNTPGYSVDFERSVADYIIGMSGYLARRKHVKDFDNAIKRIKAPALAKYAEDYRKYVNSPADEFALLKNIGFLYYIAGSTATAVANLTQVPIMTTSTLKQFVPHHIVAREVARAWGETLAMFSPTKTGLQMFDPAKVPADVRDVFKAAWEDQLFVPLETLDLMAASSIKTVGGRKTMRVLSVTTQAIAYMFMFAERLNRITTFIAAARISRMKVAKDRMRDVVKNDAWARHSIGGRAWGERNFAEWVVDESQYRMGKVNRPTVMRGVGSPLLQFKGFMMQTLEAGYRMAVMHGKGGKPAALAALAMMLMLGGIWVIPGLEDLRDMIERLYKLSTGKDLDLKTEIRQLIARETGSASLAAATNKGIPYATVGVDMSRVGMGNILPDSALQVGGIPADLAIGRPWRASEKMLAGKTTEAMSEFLPNFLKNPAMGLQWKFDGLRDKLGTRMMTPGQFDYGDVAIKSLGWTPTKVTNRREYTYAESRAERGIDELKRRYTNDLVRAYVHEDEAKDPAEKAEYKADQAKILAKIEEHNKTASPENLIKLDPDTLRRKAAAEFSGSAAREGKERKLSRGAAQDRRELFQLGR